MADSILEEMSLNPIEEVQSDEADVSIASPRGDATQDTRPGGRRSRGRGRRGGRNRRDRDTRFNDTPIENQDLSSSPTHMNESGGQEASAFSEQPTRDESERAPRRGDGRGRRRWRDRGDRPPRPHNNHQAGAMPAEANDNLSPEPARLPAFAQQEAAPVQTAFNVQPMIEPTSANPLPPTPPRDPSVAAKKGWWQKMIQLDD